MAQLLYRTALVTGATSGFGWAIAHALTTLGIQVTAIGRRAERLAELAELSPLIRPVQLDVTDSKALQQLADSLIGTEFEPQLLVNNAGAALGLSPSHQAELSDWQQMIELNISSLVEVTRLFLPSLVERNYGFIINIGSVAGSYSYPGGNVYGATKAFVAHFSDNLRSDLLGTKVKVCCLEPGLAKTEFSLVRFAGDEARASSVYSGSEPLVAEDIAGIVNWLVSLPPHVNVNSLEVMPVCQAWGPFAVARSEVHGKTS